MSNNIVSQLQPNPWPVIVTDPAAPDSGDPVRFGALTGIAVDDENATTGVTVVDFGLWVADIPVTDSVGGGIAVGDTLFYDDALDAVANTASGAPFGIALEVVGIGATTTINVMHSMGLGSGALGAGTIATANLAAGILSANAAGRALMAADYFNAATVLTKFDADSFDNANLLLAVADGAFAASAATRALFADDFLTGDKLAEDVVRVSVVAGEDETSTHTITCTGMEVGDEVVEIIVLTTAAAIASMAAHAGTRVAAVDSITTDTEVNNTGNQYLIVWIDKTP